MCVSFFDHIEGVCIIAGIDIRSIRIFAEPTDQAQPNVRVLPIASRKLIHHVNRGLDPLEKKGSVVDDDTQSITMHCHGLLFKAEKRPYGEPGSANIQEWSVMIEQHG